MASNNGNFMQSKEAQIVLNVLTAAICAFYAVDGVREMLSPERWAQLVASIGQTPYYILTIARIVVCAWVSIVFCRMAAKLLMAKDDKDE